MKPRLLSLALVAALASALFAISAACGGGAEALTLQEYFQRLDATENKLSQEGEALPEPEINDDDVLDEQEKKSLRQNIDAFVSILENFRNTVADLEPPQQVEGDHSQTLARLDDVIQALQEAADRAQDAESTSELEDIFADTDTAFQELDQACVALQKVADDNNVQADLNCQGEQAAPSPTPS